MLLQVQTDLPQEFGWRSDHRQIPSLKVQRAIRSDMFTFCKVQSQAHLLGSVAVSTTDSTTWTPMVVASAGTNHVEMFATQAPSLLQGS